MKGHGAWGMEAGERKPENGKWTPERLLPFSGFRSPFSMPLCYFGE